MQLPEGGNGQVTWFRVDDTLAHHHKVVKAGNAAMGLWVRAASWCAQQLTDGHVPIEIASQLGTAPQIARLVSVRLWHEVDGGYQFHEWSSHQRPDYRPNIPDAVRFAVYERDGYCCVTCGAAEPLSLDHIWPWSLGGADTPDNLQTLCIPCNCRKGARI